MTYRLNLGGALVGFTRCTPSAYTPNYGLNTPDDPQRVLEFRSQLAEELQAPVVWMEQTHSAVVEVVEAAQQSSLNTVSADAVIVPAGVVAAVQVADCIPIILVDSKQKMVAAVHAGRAGIEKNIIAETVRVLLNRGSRVQDLAAAVGPCICENCYEVGDDVYQHYVRLFPEGGAETSWGTQSIRLRSVAQQQLRELGVQKIVHDSACTFESGDLNSYRQDPQCGRQIGWVLFSDSVEANS